MDEIEPNRDNFYDEGKAFAESVYFYPPYSPSINSTNLENSDKWEAMHNNPDWQSERKEFRRKIYTHPSFFPIIIKVRFPPLHLVDSDFETLVLINNSVSALPHIKTMNDLKTVCQALGDAYE